jgi:hypothetical protein
MPVFRPDVGDFAVSILRPGDALHVDGQAFRQPIVPPAHFGQREMHHFVHEYPIVRQYLRCSVAADTHMNHQARLIHRAAAADPTAVHAVQAKDGERRGKPSVVIRDDVRRTLDPSAQQLPPGRGRVVHEQTQRRPPNLERFDGAVGASRGLRVDARRHRQQHNEATN